jgi:threonine dehydrogenase-like Zn-dependent dehydrogenase
VKRETVLAAVTTAPGQVVLREFPRPEIGPDDLLLRVELCGICGSDLHIFEGDRPRPYPMIQGHEFVGTVAAIGERARERNRVDVGDRVTVEVLVPCQTCSWCRAGTYNLCLANRTEGWMYGCNISCERPPHLWGAWAQYLYVPARALVHRLPDGVPWERAVLAEPLSVAVRAVHLSPIRVGEPAVVIGSGPIGLLTALVANLAGARPVILVGRREERLRLAQRLGATVVVNEQEEDPTEAVLRLTEGGAPVVFEAAGTVQSQQAAFAYARPGGTVTLLGLTGAQPVSLALDRVVVTREVRVQGSAMGAQAYPATLEILAGSGFPLEALVTHRFSLPQVEEALHTVRSRGGRCIKVVIAPWDPPGPST